jgi:hypothetical protein
VGHSARASRKWRSKTSFTSSGPLAFSSGGQSGPQFRGTAGLLSRGSRGPRR